MPTCRELVAEAGRYLDGELTWADWLELRLHMLLCPPCHAYLEQLEITVDALSRLPSEPIPEAVNQELVRRFEAWCASRSGGGRA